MRRHAVLGLALLASHLGSCTPLVGAAADKPPAIPPMLRALGRAMYGSNPGERKEASPEPAAKRKPTSAVKRVDSEDPDGSLPSGEGELDQPTLETLERELMVKESASRAASRLGKMGPAGMRVLAKGLRVERSEVHWASAWELGRMGKVSLPTLADALSDQNPSIQYAASCGLGSMGEPARATLIRALKHENSSVRRKAAEGLGNLRSSSEQLVPLLIESMQDADRSVRDAASTAVAKLGRGNKHGLNALLARLKSDPEKDNLAYSLSQYGPEAVPGLIEALRADDWQTRMVAARALGTMKSKPASAIPVIVELLHGAPFDYSTLEAVGRFGPKTLPLFTQAMKSESSNQRRAAAHGLQEVGPEAVPLLLEALADHDAYVRGDAAMSLSRVAKPVPKEAVPLLVQSLKDSSSRYSAAGALANAGSPGVESLLAAAKDGDERLRAVVLRALGGMDPVRGEAVELFVEALGSENRDVHAAARDALARMGARAAPALAKSMQHQDPSVRIKAAQILRDLDSAQSLPTFVAGLGDGDATVRMLSADALARIGASAETGVPGLVGLLQDGDLAVRMAAVHALGRVGESAVPRLIQGLESPEVRPYAQEALVKIGTPAVPALLAARRGAGRERRELIEDLLARIGPNGAAALSAAMGTGDADTRCVLVMVLGRMRPAPVALLAKAVQDGNAEVRMLAIDGLARSGPRAGRAVPELVAALKDQDERVGMLAIDALGAIGPAASEAVPALLGALRSTMLRTRAAEALGRIGGTAIPALISLLGDPDPNLRAAAVYALGRAGQGSNAAANALLPLLKDPDETLRLLAAEALGRVGSVAAGRLRNMLADQGFPERWLAALALGRMGAQARDAANELAKAVLDDDQEVGSAAAAALGQLGPAAEGIVPQLCDSLAKVTGETRLNVGWALWQINKHPWAPQVAAQTLASPELHVRLGSALALGRLGPDAKDAVPLLIQAIEDKNEQVCAAAALALAQIGPDAGSAVDALRKSLSRVNGEARLNVGWALWRIRQDPWGPQVLAQTLEYPDPNIRRDSAALLGHIGAGAKEAVPALTTVLADKTTAVRAAAAMALGQIGAEAKSAVPALVEVLEDAVGETRLNVAWALWQIERSSLAVPHLLETLKDPNPQVRLASAGALAQVGTEAKAGVPALADALRDEDAEVRAMAAAALGQLGQEARVAIPALLNALKDEQESVRQRAGPSLLATGGSFAWALPPLVKAFEHEPLRVRKAAAAALLSSPKQDQDEEPMTARQLLDIVQKGEEESRCVAALMLAARGREAASFVSSLERALEGEASSRVRWAVMWALGIARLESQNR